MDAQRALLDQLMGADRNLHPNERVDRKRKFTDPEVDKMYLVGCSPYELFAGSKSDLGPNPKIPDDDCKAQWDTLPQEEKDRYGYEDETRRFIENLLRKLDRKIEQHKLRCRVVDVDALESTAKKALELEQQIKILYNNIEPMARIGEVSRALQIYSQINLLKEQMAQLMVVPDAERRLFVCETTGNLIARNDSDDRLRSHFEGKQYHGWKTCRLTLDKLNAKLERSNAGRSDRWRWDNGNSHRREASPEQRRSHYDRSNSYKERERYSSTSARDRYRDDDDDHYRSSSRHHRDRSSPSRHERRRSSRSSSRDRHYRHDDSRHDHRSDSHRRHRDQSHDEDRHHRRHHHHKSSRHERSSHRRRSRSPS